MPLVITFFMLLLLRYDFDTQRVARAACHAIDATR